MAMIRKEVDRQPLVVINDKTSKDVKLLVSPSNFQIGIEKKFSTLRVVGETIAAGGLSVSISAYSSGQVISSNDTVALILGGGSIALPEKVRDGHLIFIKDGDGSASISNIVVSADGLPIDASMTNIMSVNYQS